MAKHTFKVGPSAADSEPGGGGFYDGPKPPAGVYTVELKFMRIKTNRNDDEMLNVCLEIAEPKGDKSKFNGYAVWDNLNVTDEGAGYINALLDVMGISRKVFWDQGVQKDNATPNPNVTKIGTKRPDGSKFRIATKDDEYKGVEKLIVSRYLPMKDDESEEAETEEVLDSSGNSVDEESAVEPTEAEEGEEEPLSDEELEAMSLDELKEICDAWEIKYTSKATEKILVKKIKDLQEASTEEPAEEEAAEEEAVEEAAEESEEAEEGEGETTYEEDELKGYEIDDLKAILTEQFEKPLPKPPIKPRIIKAILSAQAVAAGEPPF